MVEMGAWAGIAAGDAEGPLWVESGRSSFRGRRSQVREKHPASQNSDRLDAPGYGTRDRYHRLVSLSQDERIIGACFVGLAAHPRNGTAVARVSQTGIIPVHIISRISPIRIISRITNFLLSDKRTRRIIDRIRNRLGILVRSDFPVFSPESGGPRKDLAHLTAKAASQTFPFLVRLLELTTSEPFENPVPLQTFADTENARYAAATLKHLFDKYEGDKGWNNYHHVYGTILQTPNTITDILEIGVGTNNADVVSHLWPTARPGASLRAFSEFLPHAMIVGADIDKRILFEEKNIKTFFVDQTKLETFDLLASRVNRKFDLIIDDGLHAPNANIASLIFALKYLKKDGWFVVEDIQSSKLPLWRVVSKMLPDDCKSWIVDCKPGWFLFVMKRSGTS